MKKPEKPKEEANLPAVPPQPAENLPATLSQNDIQQMYGDMTQEDFKVPRVVILEGLSPEVSDGLGKPGDIFIKGLNINLGKEPLTIVVLMRQKSRIKWNPLDKGGGMACQSLNGRNGVGNPGGNCYECAEQMWSGQEKPLCDLYENFIVVLPEHKDLPPVAISGNRSRLGKFKDFNTMLEVHRMKNRPLFDKEYVVKVVPKTNKQGAKYHIFQFMPTIENTLLHSSVVTEYMTMFKNMSAKPVIIDHERETDEGPKTVEGI